MTFGADPDPIVNDAPKVEPNNDDQSWFDYKYIMNTFDENFVLIMGITGVALILLVLICIIHKCKKSKKYSGYSKYFDDVEQETFNNVEDK